ncbi:MAG: dephospho-CoA kinase [Longimicrobiales bacterium]
MISVGLTGNVGSGKSTVAALWKAQGIPMVSADDLAREAVLPGTPGLAAVRAAFGDGVIAPDGTLDRARMRGLVFSDPAARDRLERILHPLVAERRARWVDERRRAGEALIVSEIPLLFEKGLESDYDVTVLVDAPETVRLERLVRLRGLDAAEARLVMAAQMDPARKRAAATWVIDNAGTTAELERAAARVLSSVREHATGRATVKLDLHLHTRGSRDCLTDPEAVLARALSLGYARIAITDHDRMGVALDMSARYPQHVIPGEEVKTAEGIDVIGLYLSEEIPKGTPARETIERIKAQGGVAYLPHPYAPGKGGGGRLAEQLAPLCDVVEVFNARLHAAVLNRRAQDLAARTGRLCGAGSDAHTVREIGNAFVELPPHANRADAFLAALAQGRTGGTPASQLVHLASTWAKVRKKLPGGGAG